MCACCIHVLCARVCVCVCTYVYYIITTSLLLGITLVSHGQTTIVLQGVVAFSISARKVNWRC